MADETQAYGPPDPAATPVLPKVGDIRHGAKTGDWRWSGQKWEPVRPQQSFLGTEDFTGRMKRFAEPVLKTMGSDLASPVLHPINFVSNALYPELHPLDTLQAVENLAHPETYQGLAEMAKGVDPGDPELWGHVLSMLAAPKVGKGATTVVNKAAHAVADNPAVRSSLGAVGGATAAGATVGHPFIGMGVGRVLSPLLRRPAEATAYYTDRLLGNQIAPVTEAERAQAGTIGNKPPAPTTPTVNQSGPDVWERAAQATQQEPLPTVPKEFQDQYSAWTQQFGRQRADVMLARAIQQGKPPASPQPVNVNGGGPPPSVGPRTTLEETGETPEQWRARVQAQIDKSRSSQPTPEQRAAVDAEHQPVGGEAQFNALRKSPEGANASTIEKMQADLAELNKKYAPALRGEYGAARVGKIRNPSAPEVGTGDVLRDAPGPSSMPEMAWQPLKRDILAGKSADPAKTLRSLQQLLKQPDQKTAAQRIAELLNDYTPEGK